MSRRDAEFLKSEGRWEELVLSLQDALARKLDLTMSPNHIETMGGVVVKLKGAHLLYRNTLEDVAQRNGRELKLRIRSMLFEEG